MSENKTKQKTFAKGVFIREVKFEDGNSLLNVSIAAKNFCEFMQPNVNDRGYVNLTIVRNTKTDSKYSHSMLLNDYDPKKSAQASIKQTSEEVPF